MKIGKLYIKILLSFVLVLVVTEILIFVLFMHAAGGPIRERFEQYTRAKVLIVKELIEDNIRRTSDIPVSQREDIKNLFIRTADLFQADVWLTSPDDSILIKSFQGSVPADIKQLNWEKAKKFENLTLFHEFRRHFGFYAIIPIELNAGEVGGLHILFKDFEKERPEWTFLLGLIGIGVIIALLVIPLSRFITLRLKALRQSTLQIAEGDLSHRVASKGKDEIAELGRSFNLMTDKLERMILGSRELTANVSHELRSPLARIRVSEELLRDRLEQTGQKELLWHTNDIREDIEQLDHLIGRILELSKLDIYETPLNYDSLDIADLINGILEQLSAVINSRGLKIEKKLIVSSTFMGDRETLRSALSNIFDNAVKFTAENGMISVDTFQENNDSLAINITNSFQRLAEDELNHLFDPFYRTEKSLETGSGLGLAIAKKSIERHGGDIKAQNTEKGLMFQIRLPDKL